MNRIFLVHISDIHIGSGAVGTQYSSWGPLSGFNGHSLLLCEALVVALRRARLREYTLTGQETFHFVVSGDLTRTGSENDFYLAYTYLLGHFHQDRFATSPVGLGVPPDQLRSVAGNHDHWDGFPGAVWPLNGFRPPAHNPALYPRFFDRTAWRRNPPIWSPNKDFALELFGVDSNSGIMGYTNFRAAGALSPNELTLLDDRLQDSWDEQKKDGFPRIRAIVCHHAFTNHGGLLDARPLAPASRHALLDIAHRHEVAAILTGHTHYLTAVDYTDPQKRNPYLLWELRSPSTTQMDPQPAAKGFWLHEIGLGKASPTWRAWKYLWGGAATPQFDRDAQSTNPIPVR